MQCLCLYVYDVYFILLCYFCSIFIWHVYLDKLNLELHGTLFGTLDFPDYFFSDFPFYFLIVFSLLLRENVKLRFMLCRAYCSLLGASTFVASLSFAADIEVWPKGSQKIAT